MEWSSFSFKVSFLILIITVLICILLTFITNVNWENFLCSSEPAKIQRFRSYIDYLPGADVLGPFQLQQWYQPANVNWTLEEPQIISGYKTVLFLMTHEQAMFNQGASLFNGCPESRCIATTKRKFFNQSAGVVFVASQLHARKERKPKRYHNAQVFIFMIGESPNMLSFAPENWLMTPNLFNWTMTYRLDSDIPSHFTYKVPLEHKPRNFATEKTKLVAWIVSHCRTESHREDYVRELSKHISVDVYGSCGNFTCPRNNSCLEILRDYKFYLSFENSICHDYVTEKFTNALQYETVPVALGDGNYDIFPPHSFVHAYNFSSPKSLAEYLLMLDKNDAAYNEHMAWRFVPELVQSHGKYAASQNGFCRLCQKLHTTHRFPKTYSNLAFWWWKGKRHGKPRCRPGLWLLRNDASRMF